ncbi:MAG: ABC transporter permease [Solirubrobacterales bacterium]
MNLRANRHRWFGGVAFVALVFTLLFLITPILAILTNTDPRTLIDSIGEPANREALWLSLKTTLAALLIIILVGTPAAYFLANSSFRGRSAVLTLIELPLVMPPTVAGIALLAAFGPAGLFGPWLESAGIELVFETAGVVLALVFVASPFYLRQAIAAFAAIDPGLIDASRTLGSSPFRTFARVAIPIARPSLASGVALAWGRALGEFGATLLFAGSLVAVTQTAPLAIFARFSDPDGFTQAIALSVVLIIISAALLMAVKLSGGDRALDGRGL